MQYINCVVVSISNSLHMAPPGECM